MIYDIESIRVDGQSYAIQWVEMPDIRPSCIAQVNFDLQKILLYKTTEQNDIASLLHELVHVINENRMGGKLVEADVEAMATGLTQVLLDNQDFTLAMAMQGVEFQEDEEGEQEDDFTDL